MTYKLIILLSILTSGSSIIGMQRGSRLVLTDHAIERMQENDISPNEIADVLKMGMEIPKSDPDYRSKSEKKIKFYYNGIVVVCNINTGKVITTYRRESEPCITTQISEKDKQTLYQNGLSPDEIQKQRQVVRSAERDAKSEKMNLPE